MNKCRFVLEYDCGFNLEPPKLSECEFCLRMRQTYITVLRPVDRDYNKMQGDLKAAQERIKELEKGL